MEFRIWAQTTPQKKIYLHMFPMPQLGLAAARHADPRGVGPQVAAVLLLEEVLRENQPLELRVLVLVRILEQEAKNG